MLAWESCVGAPVLALSMLWFDTGQRGILPLSTCFYEWEIIALISLVKHVGVSE